MSLREMVDEALRLPEQDRATLAATLIESLDRKMHEVSREAWDAEIRSRLDELDRGEVIPVPGTMSGNNFVRTQRAMPVEFHPSALKEVREARS